MHTENCDGENGGQWSGNTSSLDSALSKVFRRGGRWSLDTAGTMIKLLLILMKGKYLRYCDLMDLMEQFTR